MPSMFRLLLVALLWPGLAQSQDLLGIYRIALENDAGILAARYARDAALEGEPLGRAALLPQLSAGYDVLFNDTDIDVTYVDPTTGFAVPLSRHNDGTDRSLSVTLSQPLFNVEAWHRFKQSSAQAALAHLNYRASEQALILQVAERYFGVLSARDALRSIEAEKGALQRQLDLTRRQLEVGLSSITDTQEVEARYDLSVATVLETEQALTHALEGLVEITRPPILSLEDSDRVRVVPLPVDLERLPSLRSEFVLPAPNPASAARWVEFALNGSPELLMARQGYTVAERSLSAAQARHLPTVTATASYQDARSESGAFPTEMSGTVIGVGVRLPLLAGGATRAQVRQAEAVRGQRLSEYDSTRRAVERNVRTAYQAVLTSAARIHALKQAVASSQTALNASETGLRIGTRSAIDVLNAQQQRYAAERNYDQTRYDYLLSVLQLKALVGQLTAGDLQEVDALLERTPL